MSPEPSGPWPAQSLARLELVEFGHFPVSSFFDEPRLRGYVRQFPRRFRGFQV